MEQTKQPYYEWEFTDGDGDKLFMDIDRYYRDWVKSNVYAICVSTRACILTTHDARTFARKLLEFADHCDQLNGAGEE